jgi:hypothetical protein
MPMTTENASRIFLDRTRAFFDDVDHWIIDDHRLRADRRPYPVPKDYGGGNSQILSLFADGAFLAEFVPAGAFVVGARGRIDVRGRVDQAVLLYLEGPGESRVTMTDDAGNVAFNIAAPLFSGVTGPGWYWVGSGDPRAATLVDERAFRDIVASVSDYRTS